MASVVRAGVPGLALAALRVAVGCSGDLPPALENNAPRVDEVAPAAGVSARGREPGIVALVGPGGVLCAAALVAPDVVLTAGICVTQAVPRNLGVLVGDTSAVAQVRAHGRAIAPQANAAGASGLALVLLDFPIVDAEVLVIGPAGAARGDHLRTVGVESSTGGAWAKVVRDHVPVLDATAAGFRVEEAPYLGGRIALDDATGEIAGVAARVGRPGGGDYLRAAAAAVTLADLLGSAGPGSTQSAAAVANGERKPEKGPFDLGATCEHAKDCAAGVCVTEVARQYCSRSCGAHDRCPSRYRCKLGRAREGEGQLWACAEN